MKTRSDREFFNKPREKTNTFKSVQDVKALRGGKKISPIDVLAQEIVEDIEAGLEQFRKITDDLPRDPAKLKET